MSDAFLCVRDLSAGYGEAQVLEGVSFDLRAGETVALLGRNGVGKTTTLKALMGLLSQRTGGVRFDDCDLLQLPPHRLAAQGIGYMPEERGIYASLSVEENLLLPRAGPGGLSTDRLFELFPNLAERRRSAGTNLSGGEQQMLAIARVLRMGLRLLILDEPTEGLAPAIVSQIAHVLAELKAGGMSMLLVEQNFRFARRIADRFLVMEHGRIIADIPAPELPDREAWLAERLGV